MSLTVLCVLRIRHRIRLLLASCNHSPCPSDPGRTLHWTWSPDCPRHQVTLFQFSPSLTGFLRLSTLLPCRSFHLPWRLLGFLPSTCSVSTVFLVTSSLAQVRSSHSRSKKLAPRFIEPFPVQVVLNPVTVQLALPRNMRIHYVFHVSQVRPVQTSPLCLPPGSPPSLTSLVGHREAPVRRGGTVRV